MSDAEKKEIRDVILGVPTLYFVGKFMENKSQLLVSLS
jgi:hypothetical protein